MRLPALVALGLAWSSALPARALEDYADEIKSELELSDKPSCLYCHARDEDWKATDTPFNDALKTRGFTRRMGLPSLRSALAELEEDGTDSDGDGVGDVDELRAGANPNDPDDSGLPPPACSARPGRADWTAPWLVLAVLGLLLGRRYRQRPVVADWTRASASSTLVVS